ncbi:hypothetical protein [Nocardioides gilvus]|uniref:hypothetical protein n=1 Tax=Nocardioides gilvus TaxID=1735589 RepID=UPI0013A5A432|nr:hypothetical protein [Nocardioides gilvus]
MEVDELLRRWGGVATRAQLLTRLSRSEVDRTLVNGSVLRVGHGRYGLPHLTADLARAHGLSAVVSHESAALQHGWSVLLPPEQSHLTFPTKRRVKAVDLPDVVLHRADLLPDDISGSHTSQDRTMLDCLRIPDVRRALSVADSALRAGRAPAWLHRIAAEARGPGSGQARRVAAHATDCAANSFESGLRAISLDVPALRMRPQVRLHDRSGEFMGRPDLVDTELRIIAEADSFEWHGGRSALVRDARRYNRFVVEGWMVLRFTWDDVVLEPARVQATLAAAAEERSQPRKTPQNRRNYDVDSVRPRTKFQKPNVR